jgi:hypothetical protein
MDPIKEFGRTAQNLARNPLGIIALFIVLLYGIAGLVLNSSASTLQPQERLPLIWFLAIFPVIVLVVFAWLVSNHHRKLYGPSDFKSDDAFLQIIPPETQRTRLEKEVIQLNFDHLMPKSITKLRNNFNKIDNNNNQKNDNNMSIVDSTRKDVVLAEDLVLRKLEAELGAPIRRQSSIYYNNIRIDLNGLVQGEKQIAIEIKLFRQQSLHNNLNNRLAEVAYLAQRLAASPLGSNLSLIFVVVDIDLSTDSSVLLKERMDPILKTAPLPIEVKIFKYEDLKAEFGIGA